MRHRMGNIMTGLGNPNKVLLDNSWSDNQKLNKIADEFLKDALVSLTPIVEYGGFDFSVRQNDNEFSIDFGYEPAYQYEELRMYHIDTDKAKCGLQVGRAKGYYGSDIEVYKNILYSEMDEETQVFINKWHDKLLESLNKKQ